MPEKKLTTGQDDRLVRIAAVVIAAAINAAQLEDTQKEELKSLLRSPSRGASVPRGLKGVYPQVLEAQELFDKLPSAKRQEVLTIVVRAIANPNSSEIVTTIPKPPASNTSGRPIHNRQRQDELLTTQEAKRLPPGTSIRAFQQLLRRFQILSNAPVREQLRRMGDEMAAKNPHAFPSGEDARLRAYKNLLALAADGQPYRPFGETVVGHRPFGEIVVGQCTPGRNSITDNPSL